jgi:hypothetical protein
MTTKAGFFEMVNPEDPEEVIEVHPATVDAHRQAGWKLLHPEDLVKMAQAGVMQLKAEGKPVKAELVKMFKDGEQLLVHPDTVAAHIKAHWTVIDQGYLKQAVETAEKIVKAETAPKRTVRKPAAVAAPAPKKD